MEVITINADKTGVLKEACEHVKDYSEIQPAIDGMKELLFGAYNGKGKGLAAPQVGINKRFFLIRFGNRIEVFINPEITKYGNVKEVHKEGCLSILGAWYEVERSRKIEVRYQDENMNIRRVKFHDFDAIAFQHEMNHCDGILISDIGKRVA
jgi:peptide deformylase